MQIIPAIDILNGKCVRLSKGDFEQKKVYNENPLEVALQFEDAGLERLHLVDLDGAKAGELRNWKVLEKIAGKTNLVIDFSGGINNRKSVTIGFDSGAAFIAIGSVAVKNESDLSGWLIEFGADRFILGADVSNEVIVVRGWTEVTDISVFDHIKKYKANGIKQFLSTDISKDGLLEGPSFQLYKKIKSEIPEISLIASGGISNLNDIEELENIGCEAAIVGKAIYENRVSLADLKKWV